jgi:hypothetical protein
MVCIESHVAGSLPGAPVYATGTKLHADHPAVQACPDYWLPSDSTTDEVVAHRSTALGGATAEPEPDPDLPTALPKLRDADAMVAVAEGLADPGLWVRTGDRLHRDDEVVRNNPDMFRPVLPRGLDREKAVLCLTNLSESHGPETVVTYWAGTLVARDSQAVKASPEHFALPPVE